MRDKSKDHWKIIAIIASIILLVVLGNLNDDSGSSSRKTEDLRTDACVTSHVYLNQMLKSPTTAKYPACSLAKVSNLGDGKWVVQSYVDSQNSFGATMRMHYEMELLHLGGDNWQYLSVETDP